MRIPIVGSHFHPPAKAVLACLPAGWPLILIHDRNNEYDELAIRVLTRMDLEGVPDAPEMCDRLDAECQAYGWTGEEIFDQADPLWLGFIAKTGAKTTKGGPGNGELHTAFEGRFPILATLTFDEDGAACAGGFEAGEMSGEDPWWERRPWNE